MKLRINFFEKIAPLYDWFHFLRSGKTVSAIERELDLSSKDVVLDLAGGTGRVAVKLKNKVKKIFVIDASQRMLRVCACKNLHGIHGFAEKIPFPNGFFNKIIIIDALHHFQNCEPAIAEIKRVLKNGGQLFIEEINPCGTFGKILKFVEKILRMNSHFYSSFELEAIFIKHFDLVKTVELSKNFYVLVAKK